MSVFYFLCKSVCSSPAWYSLVWKPEYANTWIWCLTWGAPQSWEGLLMCLELLIKVFAEKGFRLVIGRSCGDTWLIAAPRHPERGSVFVENVDAFICELFDINLNYCYYNSVYYFLWKHTSPVKRLVAKKCVESCCLIVYLHLVYILAVEVKLVS